MDNFVLRDWNLNQMDDFNKNILPLIESGLKAKPCLMYYDYPEEEIVCGWEIR